MAMLVRLIKKLTGSGGALDKLAGMKRDTSGKLRKKKK